MAFDVNSLTQYVKQNETSLIGKTIFGGKTLDLIQYQPEIKGDAKINLIQFNPTLQAGGCSWSPLGDVVLSERILSTSLFKAQAEFCDTDLRKYQYNYDVNIMKGREVLPLENQIVDEAVASINNQLEMLSWNGDTSLTGTTYLKETNGFIKILSLVSGSTVSAKVSGKTLSGDTIVAINSIVANLPLDVKSMDDVVIFTGRDVVSYYIAAINASNNYHTVIMEDGSYTITVPNTNIKLVGTKGLDGKGKAYASTLKNFYAGGDIEGAETKFKLWYEEGQEKFYFSAKTNIGFQIAIPEWVVTYID